MSEPTIPDRYCSGGPNGPWCGKPATSICSGHDGKAHVHWYACPEHVGKALVARPILEWLLTAAVFK
jgi:hypothetical protein